MQLKKNNKTELISILRGYYTLWLTIDFNTIKIHKKFPETFILLQEVNKTNHKHVPKIFKKNTSPRTSLNEKFQKHTQLDFMMKGEKAKKFYVKDKNSFNNTDF